MSKIVSESVPLALSFATNPYCVVCANAELGISTRNHASSVRGRKRNQKDVN